MVVWMVPRFSSMVHGSILWDFVGTWRVRVPIQLDFCGISTLQKMNQMIPNVCKQLYTSQSKMDSMHQQQESHMGTQKFRLGIPICEEFKSVAFVGKRWFWRKKNCERSKNGPLKNDNFGVFLFFLQQTQSELDLLFFFTGKRSHQRLLSQALSSYEAPQFPLNSGVYEVERPKYCRFDGPSSSTRRSPEVWLKFKNNNHQTPTIYGLISQRKYTRNIMEIS